MTAPRGVVREVRRMRPRQHQRGGATGREAQARVAVEPVAQRKAQPRTSVPPGSRDIRDPRVPARAPRRADAPARAPPASRPATAARPTAAITKRVPRSAGRSLRPTASQPPVGADSSRCSRPPSCRHPSWTSPTTTLPGRQAACRPRHRCHHERRACRHPLQQRSLVHPPPLPYSFVKPIDDLAGFRKLVKYLDDIEDRIDRGAS